MLRLEKSVNFGIFERKRNQIYLAFLAFGAFGAWIDWFFWRYDLPQFTWNDLIQMIGTIAFCRAWQARDAADQKIDQSRSSRILTFLMFPLGMAVYFFQTRPAKAALGGLALFLFGYIATILSAFFFCAYVLERLFPQAI